VSAGEPGRPRRGAAGRIGLGIALLVAVVVLAVGAFTLGRSSAGAIASPPDTGADAGFARDMPVHHNQGVELAMLIRDRSS
jgi:hypothetical protein